MRIRVTQERFLGAALGAIFTGAVVFEQRRRIYKSIAENDAQFASHPQVYFPNISAIFDMKINVFFIILYIREFIISINPSLLYAKHSFLA